MQFRALASVGGLTIVLLASLPARAAGARPDSVIANDNTNPAGVRASGVTSIKLRAGIGSWQPEGPSGPALTIEAFGEENAPLSVPAPLIRVAEGETVAVSVRNDLPAPLRVHGLCTPDGGACPPLDVPPGTTRDVRFPSGRAGTYHYWATTMNAPVPFRELAGALVVGPKEC